MEPTVYWRCSPLILTNLSKCQTSLQYKDCILFDVLWEDIVTCERSFIQISNSWNRNTRNRLANSLAPNQKIMEQYLLSEPGWHAQCRYTRRVLCPEIKFYELKNLKDAFMRLRLRRQDLDAGSWHSWVAWRSELLGARRAWNRHFRFTASNCQCLRDTEFGDASWLRVDIGLIYGWLRVDWCWFMSLTDVDSVQWWAVDVLSRWNLCCRCNRSLNPLPAMQSGTRRSHDAKLMTGYPEPRLKAGSLLPAMHRPQRLW